MDWTDLLQPWGLVALVLVSIALVVAIIVVLFRGKFRVKEVEIPLLFAKIKAERVTEDEDKKEKGRESPPKSPTPRRSRTHQRAKALHGAQASIEQSAPKGAAATQEGTADGEGTELDLKQTIH